MNSFLKIYKISSNSHADNIGLKTNDVIAWYGDYKIHTNSDLSNASKNTKEDMVSIIVIRQQKAMTFEAEKKPLGINCLEIISEKDPAIERMLELSREELREGFSNNNNEITGDNLLLSTTDSIPGMKVVEFIGLARAGSVRSKNAISDLGAGIKSIVGGELKSYTALMRDGREEVIHRLQADAKFMGANAIIGIRFTSATIDVGAAEICAYGTAVKVEKEETTLQAQQTADA